MSELKSMIAQVYILIFGKGYSYYFQGHPVIDYRVSVSRARKPPTNNERVMAAGLSKMLRRFSIDTTSTHAKQNKPNFVPEDTY